MKEGCFYSEPPYLSEINLYGTSSSGGFYSNTTTSRLGGASGILLGSYIFSYEIWRDPYRENMEHVGVVVQRIFKHLVNRLEC